MDIPRVKSGIAGLDEKIKGGLPNNSVILVYGPPKCGKTIFSIQCLNAGLKNEEPSLYISSNASIDQLKQLMMSFNISTVEEESKGLIYYIDLFSIRAGETKDSAFIKNVAPNATTKIMITMGEAYKSLCPKGIQIRTFFDSLTPLIESNPDVISRFLQTFIAKNKAAGSTTIITYTKGIANEKLETLFKSVVDGTFYLDGNGKMVIESLAATPTPITLKYNITEKGIVVS